MFFDQFKLLCDQKSLSPNRVAKELNISSGSVTAWKKDGVVPNTKTLLKIADYFDVRVDYLLGNDKDGNPIHVPLAELIAAANEKDESQKKDEHELLSVYQQLDSKGKTMVKAKAYEELERVEKTYKHLP